MRNDPFPAAVTLCAAPRSANFCRHFQTALRASLRRRGFRPVGFDREGDELLAVARRDGCVFGAVYNMLTGKVVLRDVWAGGRGVSLDLLQALRPGPAVAGSGR